MAKSTAFCAAATAWYVLCGRYHAEAKVMLRMDLFLAARSDSICLDRPYLFVFSAVGAGAALVLASSILHHDDDFPFYAVSLTFASALRTLTLSFWPYMIPFVITIDQAAAPHSSLAFMFWGKGSSSVH
jgi:cytochrome bd-type quinol oxidase subunit 2